MKNEKITTVSDCCFDRYKMGKDDFGSYCICVKCKKRCFLTKYESKVSKSKR